MKVSRKNSTRIHNNIPSPSENAYRFINRSYCKEKRVTLGTVSTRKGWTAAAARRTFRSTRDLYNLAIKLSNTSGAVHHLATRHRPTIETRSHTTLALIRRKSMTFYHHYHSLRNQCKGRRRRRW